MIAASTNFTGIFKDENANEMRILCLEMLFGGLCIPLKKQYSSLIITLHNYT